MTNESLDETASVLLRELHDLRVRCREQLAAISSLEVQLLAVDHLKTMPPEARERFAATIGLRAKTTQ